MLLAGLCAQSDGNADTQASTDSQLHRGFLLPRHAHSRATSAHTNRHPRAAHAHSCATHTHATVECAGSDRPTDGIRRRPKHNRQMVGTVERTQYDRPLRGSAQEGIGSMAERSA